MMENAREALSNILLSKKEKCIQNCIRQSEQKDCAVDQNTVSDKNDLLLDRSFNKCCFCIKVFASSKFLIQHILRRHSENLVIMYRKLNDLNVADHLSQRDVINIITSEFSKLRCDLLSIKSSLSDYQANQSQLNSFNPIQIQSSSPVKELDDLQTQKSFASVEGKVDELTTQLQALRVTNEKIEKDIDGLKVQWSKSDVKDLCNSSNVKDTLIYQTLKSDLLMELRSLIRENNEKLQLNINQLSLNFKADVERLEDSIKANLEKIDTSTLVQETLKSLEKEIEIFFSCHKAKKFKTHNSEVTPPKKISPNVRKVKPNFNQETVNFDNEKKPLTFEKKLNTSNISTGSKKLLSLEHKINKLKAHDWELNLAEKIDKAVKKVESNLSQESVEVCPEFKKRLNILNIPSGTIRLSNTDYSAKMKLVESRRKALHKKNPSFSSIYQDINFIVDKNISQRFKAGRKSKKVRFSLKSKASCKKLKNKVEGGDTKLMERLTDFQDCSSIEDISIQKQATLSTPIGDAKFSEKLSSLQDDSPIVDNSVGKSVGRNITPINISDTKLVNLNLSKHNSAASLRLISSSNKKRELPSVPQQFEPKEQSPYDSLESDF